MRLLVMSDTHGDAEVIQLVRDRHEYIDATIHCGDSELPFDHPYLEKVKRVRGNCDRDTRYPDEEMFTVDGITIFVTHGHLFNVKSTTMNLYYRAQEVKANVVLFGHSHVLGVEFVDNILFVNPGSLLKPKGIDKKSYVLMEYKEGKWTINAYTHTGKTIFTKTFRE